MSLRGSQKSPPWRGGLAGAEIGVARGPKKPENRPGNGPEIARKSPQIGPKIDPKIDPAGGGKFPRKMPDFPVLAGPRKMANFGGRRANFRNPVPKLSRKSEKLSRMGELLNTLRNVQNSGARPAPPGPGNPGSGGRVRDPGFPAPPAPGNPGPEGGSRIRSAGPDFAPPGSPRPTPRSRRVDRRDVTPTGERSWSRDPGPDSDRSAGWWSVTDPTGVWQMTRRDGDDGHPIKTFPIGRRVMTTSRSAAPPVMSRPKKNSVGGRRS